MLSCLLFFTSRVELTAGVLATTPVLIEYCFKFIDAILVLRGILLSLVEATLRRLQIRLTSL